MKNEHMINDAQMNISVQYDMLSWDNLDTIG